jgi:DNA replication and repair protein RecF
VHLAVTRLRLAAFRNHAATRLELAGGPVVLWGPNGAGKTSLLEAVSLLTPGRGLRGAAADELARAPGAAGWKVAAEVAAPDGPVEIETGAGPGEPRWVTLGGKPVPQVALGRQVRALWLTPAMDRLWLEGAEARRRFLDRMTLGFVPGHAEAVLAYEKAMRERNRLLREGVRDGRWYAALEARMAAEGAAIRAARAATLERIAAAQAAEGGEAGFPTAELSVAEAGGEAADLAAALAASRGADMAAGRTLPGPHRADLTARYAARGLPAAQCSTGEQKALLISVILACARALAAATGATPILLLDEVAAHLDPGRRAALFAALDGLGAQAWLTGTEAGLFEGLAATDRFELAEAGGTAEVRRR